MAHNDLALAAKKIAVYRGDITKMGVDAIVNAANPTLLGGGGVDGAIHRAAGPELLMECRSLHGCAVGRAKITAGYDLPAPFVIHTVGPIWEDGKQNESQKLRACYRNSLKLALDYQLTTVAFPAISTGAYGYPKAEAAEIAVDTALKFLLAHPALHKIYFVVFDGETEALYRESLERALSISDEDSKTQSPSPAK
ncbi:MAG: O-acetyl-ADP-ribose deacetylase [Clostridia bacterium]|nr:O-acetyl-ADP-ribose deacetylase [Clostridia bacterium]